MKLWFFISVLLLTAVSASPQTPPKKTPQKTSSTSAPNEWSLRGRVAANPHDRDAHEKLCDLLEKRGEYRASLNERRAWLEDNSWDWSELISLITSAQFRLNDPEFGISATRFFLSKSTSDDEMFGWANYQLGKQLLGRDRVVEALPFLETATKSRPDMEEFLDEYAIVLIRAKRMDEGISTLRKAIELNPSSADLHIQLGNALAVKGDLSGQETEYKAACSLDKKNAKRFTSLARLQIGQTEFDEAATNLNRALELDHLALYAYLLRARMSEIKGQPSEATMQRNKAESLLAAEMRKEKPSSWNCNPMLLFIEEDAREVIRILEPSRQKLTSCDRQILGAAYIEVGRTDEGATELERSFAESKNQDAQSHFLAAESLRKIGLNQKAEDHYRNAYEMDPENMTYRSEYETLRRKNSSSK